MTAKETLDIISQKLADNFGFSYPNHMKVIFRMIEDEFKRDFPGNFTLVWNINIVDLKWTPFLKFDDYEEGIQWKLTNF